MLKESSTREIWLCRHFILSLIRMDLRNKYRKSFLGIFWALVYPLSLTLMMSIILARVFQTSLGDYVAYVYIGFVVWDFVVQSTIQGSSTYLVSEPYIKMQKKPLFIYNLRTVFGCFIQFLIGFSGVVVWVTLLGDIPSLKWISLFYAMSILLIWGLSFNLLLSVITVFFRDFGQISLLIFQMIWYVSPIFIDKSAFNNGGLLERFNNFNPVNHLLELFRQPMLDGSFPNLNNILISALSACAFFLVSFFVYKALNKRVIFYI